MKNVTHARTEYDMSTIIFWMLNIYSVAKLFQRGIKVEITIVSAEKKSLEFHGFDDDLNKYKLDRQIWATFTLYYPFNDFCSHCICNSSCVIDTFPLKLFKIKTR